MSTFEIVNVTIDNFAMLWRIKKAQSENCENPVLEQEIKTLEIKLHAFGVNTDSLTGCIPLKEHCCMAG